MIYLELEDLLALCRDLGDLPVRDLGLLEAAARRPATTLFGNEAYPSVFEKAAVLLESITRNDAFVNGNKRHGWLSMYVFLAVNDHDLDPPDDAAYDLVIAVSTGELDHKAAAAILQGWVR